MSCWEYCEENFGLSSCPESRPPDRSNETPGQCTGDEGMVDDMVICSIPNPDDPPPPDVEDEDEIVFEPTRTVAVSCDAPAPGPEWDLANLPAQEIRASPAGTDAAPGITGLDTWLWAAGERAHFWLTVETGSEGADHYGRYGARDPETSAITWGPEFVYAQPRWLCWREAVWDARVVQWAWELEGPTSWRNASGTGGTAPPDDSDGAGASAHVVPQAKGAHVIRLAPTWQGSWGDTHQPGASATSYRIDEVRSQLQP